MRSVILAGGPLTPDEVQRVARLDARVELAPAAHRLLLRGRRAVEAAGRSSEPVYGISTGFGALASTRVEGARQVDLQHALIRSHAAGLGRPVAREVVRATMLLRARTLAMGLSGVRPELVETLCQALNQGVTPFVPEHGSLGASGDLAPLAHIALALMGEGEVLDPAGAPAPAAAALEAAGIAPLRLAVKEGLALINGTDGMLGMLVLATLDAERLLRTADVSAACSVEALLGTDRPFADDLQRIRPHPGQADSASNLRRLLRGSPIVAAHRASDHAVQDSYSLRCTPQVLGAARDTLAFAQQVAERELAAAVDNPVVLPDGRVESTGNFHGEPLAFACDFLAIALAEAGAIAERRIDRLLDPARSHGLPPFLAPDAGVNSGLMLAQYTAAALVAENRRLAQPASVDSVPTSGMQEDHVSMGWAAARKLRRVVTNLERILAVELLASARGLELRQPLRPAQATGQVAERVRRAGGGVGPDRFVAPQLRAVEALVHDGSAVAAAEAALGDTLA
ncbi:MAG TPA: histidine ammonia-lyase [Verrucomicrobiae bacterium]|nr:histidine ammonia-lyase [Verrucomicrobiae bacterium]